MISDSLQLRVDRFSDRKAGHLDQPSTQILSRNTSRGIDMKQIELTQGKVAFVDDEDFDWLSKHKWHASDGRQGLYYASTNIIRNGRRSQIAMHRLIMGEPKGLCVDHANQDTLDNQKLNLRVCTKSQNAQNATKWSVASSKYKGVSWSKQKKAWEVYINHNKQRTRLGFFGNEIDAAMAYNAKATELFGEFANINVLQGKLC